MKKYPVKKKKSFIENLRIVIPLIYDDFFSNKDSVINHPLRKNELHRMRIAGKPMRYIMEIGLQFCGPQFARCYDEIKNLIETMGDVHDCDVFIPELISYLRELREFNRTIEKTGEKIPTGRIISLVKQLRFKRNKFFEQICSVLKVWERTNFRERLTRSISVRNKLSLVKPLQAG